MSEHNGVFKRMIEDIEDYAILLLDKNGNIENWNKGAEKIKGYAQNEIIGKNFRIFYTEQDIENGIPEKLIEEAGKAGKALSEGWRVRKDGSKFWGSILVTSIYDEAGAVSGFSKITRDLTERKNAEEQLKQFNAELEEKVKTRTEELTNSNLRYKHLFSNNPLPMWVIDLSDFKFLDVNDVAIAHYGYSREEFLSMTAYDIRTEEDKLLFKEVSHPEYVGSDNYNRGIWRHLKKDGTIIDVEIFGHNIVFEDKPARLILCNDITERRVAERKLVSRVQRFRALLENNNDAISLHDEAGNIVYQSPAAERMLGYTIDEIHGMNALDFFHPEDVPDVVKRMTHAMSSPGKAIWGQNRMRHKNGHYIWTEGTSTNMLHDEHVAALVGNFRDITERKLAEEQLMASEHKFRALIENSADMLMLYDKDGRLTYCSPSVLKNAGVSFKELVGSKISDNVFRDDAQKANDLIDLVFQFKGVPIPIIFRKEYNGKCIWVEGTINNLLDDLNVNAIVCNCRNITERKESEQLLENSHKDIERMLHHTDQAFIMLDKDLNVITFNRNATNHCARILQKNLRKGMSALALSPEWRWDTLRVIYNEVLAGEKKELETEHILNDTPVYFSTLFKTIKNANDEPEGIFITIRNITERVMAQRQREFDHSNLSALINNTNDLMWSVDRERKLITSNTAFDEMVKIFLGKVIEKGKDLFEEGFGKDQLDNWLSFYDRAFSGETFTEIIYTTEPIEMWSEISFYPVYKSDEIIGTACFSRDITQRKKDEAALRFSEETRKLIINAAMDAIVCTDEEGIITVWNPQSEKMFGWSAQEILGKQIADTIIPHQSKTRLRSGIEFYFGSGKKRALNKLTESTAFNREGKEFPIEVTVLPIEQNNETYYCAFIKDITERKLAEQKIINANRLYAFISQINQTIVHSPDAPTVYKSACEIAIEFGKFKMAWIGRIDREQKVISVIDQCGMLEKDLDFFQRAPYVENGPIDQVVKTGSYFISNDIENDTLLQNWTEYAKERELRSCMLLPIKKRGVIFGTLNLYASVVDLFDAEEIRLLEEVAGDISFALDVFENDKQRKDAEDKLLKNEFRLNEAQEIAHLGSWEIDFVTGVNTWSLEACRILGYSHDEMLPSFGSYITAIHPDDKEYVMKIINDAEAEYHNSFYYHRIIRQDGNVRFVYSESKYEFDSSGKPLRLHGIIHDITDSKVAEDSLAQSESNLRLIMDLIPQSIFARDAQGKYIFVNKSFADLYGLTPSELISNSVIGNDALTNKIDTFDSINDDVLATGKSETIPELVFIDHNGVKHIFYTMMVPYTLTDNSVKAVLGIALDITERKQSESERAKMMDDIVQRNKGLEQFSYIISHNLRAPVANIIGITDLINDMDLDKKEENEMMQELSNSVKKLDAVIRDLNYILQVKNQLSEKREQVSFSSLVADIKLSIDNLIKTEEAQIIFDFSHIDKMLTLKSYLYSIFFNLISNSIKYHQPDIPPVIEITSRQYDSKIELVFKDNGLGIDIKKKGDMVFGLYKRFHRHVEGKGIGLYMVKTQVETLGGKITIDSEVNKGTEFRIEFEISQHTYNE